MIETRLEELFGDGSSGGDEANESMSRGFGYEDANDMFNEMQSGMEAMRETQQEMARMAESMRENQDSPLPSESRTSGWSATWRSKAALTKTNSPS